MFCRWCLYNLSHTNEPRCPECGGAFDADDPDSTLPTDRRLAWALWHTKRYVQHRIEGRRQSRHMFCRSCYADLARAVDDRCPVCRTWFNRHDIGSYRWSDHALARIRDRFRHICFWRGMLIPLIPLIYGAYCCLTQTAFLPGAGRGSTGVVSLLKLTGHPAAFMGIAWIGLALALYSRYFWRRVEACWRYADLGVILGVLMVIAGWGYALQWAIRHTFR